MGKIFVKMMIAITISAVLVFTTFAIVSIMWTSNAMKQEIADRTYYETTKCANQISMIFENAEGAVDAISANVLCSFDMEKLKKSEAYLQAYLNTIAPMIERTLLDIEDAKGLYITFCPALSENKGIYEIWYSCNDKGEIVPTDATVNGIYLEAFSYIDAPHMQYYFEAVKNPMKGIWTDPGYDPDLKEEVLTYSKSVYVDGILVGVVGVDIATNHTTDVIGDMHVENDGSVFLLNAQGNLIISSKGITEEAKDMFSQNISQSGFLSANMKENGTTQIFTGKQPLLVSYAKLSNDWRLVILNNEKTLYASINFFKSITICMAVILTIFTIMVVFIAMQKFSSPVKKATELLKIMELEGQFDEAKKEKIQNEDDIENLVRKLMKQQREKDIFLAHQSRLAQAGEMMTSVAHQWKQPLNNINIIMGNLRDAYFYGELTQEFLSTTVERTEALVESMSFTIDDFREYLKPGVKKENFSVNRAIAAVLTLLCDKLKVNNIEVDFQSEEEFISYGYKNALYHVVLNVVTNAVDAILESDQGNRYMKITINARAQYENQIAIEIYNRGNPIPNEVKDKVFTSYFTTKNERGGTGLGLTISKNLLEKGMDGTILIDNVEGGVRCSIYIRRYYL